MKLGAGFSGVIIKNCGDFHPQIGPREQLGRPERAARLIAWLADQRPMDLNGQDLTIRDADLVKRSGIDQ